MQFFHYLGEYFLFLRRVFSKPENPRMFYKQLMRDIMSLGVDSIAIVSIISLFIGAVITIQSAYQTNKPFIPTYLVGWVARDSILLEFSSTVVALILAGKVGSHVSSEIGTMRVTEQIDVMEIMGINSASYIVLPKIIASILFNPVLTIMSMMIGIFGGYMAVLSTHIIPTHSFIYGLKYSFTPYYVVFSLIKTMFFTFSITSIAAFQGYNVRGGALEVGMSSTRSVVYSSVVILFLDLVITQMLMS
jgi:phospholipid/cholesterol/gamma-HCH transport system permease protein